MVKPLIEHPQVRRLLAPLTLGLLLLLAWQIALQQ